MKNAQVFTQDLIIALTLMSIIIIIYFSFYLNLNLNGEKLENDVISEGRTTTDYMTTSGYPLDWNATNVLRIGFADNNNIILKDKLSIFSNMSRDEYERTKSILRTKYDYLVFFRDYDGNILNITGQSFIGKNNTNDSNIEQKENPGHLATISRFLVLREDATPTTNSSARIIEMVTYVWTKEK